MKENLRKIREEIIFKSGKIQISVSKMKPQYLQKDNQIYVSRVD
jgi:hypothetical protein